MVLSVNFALTRVYSISTNKVSLFFDDKKNSAVEIFLNPIFAKSYSSEIFVVYGSKIHAVY